MTTLREDMIKDENTAARAGSSSSQILAPGRRQAGVGGDRPCPSGQRCHRVFVVYDFVRAVAADVEVTVVKERTESETDYENGTDRNDQFQQELHAGTSVRHGRFSGSGLS